MSDPVDLEHWNGHWRGLGVEHPPAAVRQVLLRCYAEPHRAYHTREHLTECLVLLESARSHCEHPDEVAIALWFHDAVYRTHRRDNESRSAAWLAKVAARAGVPAASIDRMRELVLATRHAAAPVTPDAKILVDIDLAILGASGDRYDRFEDGIRSEYRWVSGSVYRAERGKILAGFLSHTCLYSTSLFRQRYENAARANLKRALLGLAQAP